MNSPIEELVWDRARGCCEYCQMPQEFDDAPFEIDHVLAQKHGGKTTPGNLALSCFYCNSFKGTDMAGMDPLTRKRTFLFHPRRQKWDVHFRWDGPRLTGKTAVGRATIATLQINHALAVRVREALIELGEFPPA